MARVNILKQIKSGEKWRRKEDFPPGRRSLCRQRLSVDEAARNTSISKT